MDHITVRLNDSSLAGHGAPHVRPGQQQRRGEIHCLCIGHRRCTFLVINTRFTQAAVRAELDGIVATAADNGDGDDDDDDDDALSGYTE